MDVSSYTSLHANVDVLNYRYDKISGYGWIFHKLYKIDSIFLIKIDEIGNSESLQVSYGKNRRDVEVYFSDYNNSIGCGFFIYGVFLNPIHESDYFKLLCIFDNQEKIYLPISNNSINNLEHQIKTTSKKNITDLIKIYNKKLLFLFVERKYVYKILIEKIFKTKRKKIISQKKIIHEFVNSSVMLIIDHAMGGGANQYTKSYIEEYKNKSSNKIFVLTYVVSELSFNLDIYDSDEIYTIKFFGNEIKVFEYLFNYKYEIIIYNNSVSYPNPLEISTQILKLRKNSSIFKILVHDYFLICPSHTLIDYNGKYCNLPNINICNECIKKNNHVLLNNYQKFDLTTWRLKHEQLIKSADEVIFFSKSSHSIFQKVYTKNIPDDYILLPHKMDYFKHEKIKLKYNEELIIGVIGNISYIKGSELIRLIALEIKLKKIFIKICIIGTIEGNIDLDVVKVTGRYSHSELPKLIESNKINLIFFPSICPETFSFVVHEVTALDMPIACLNIGAQAEKVASYHKGKILYSDDPSVIISQLIDFHKVLLNEQK